MMNVYENTKSGHLVELRIPSELGFEKVALSTAASMATLMGFTPDRVEDLKTAVAEACINAIEHGNLLDDELSVAIILSPSEDELEVKVIDYGTGNNSAVSNPNMDLKMIGKENFRGMGTFLIQSLVDEVEWHHGPGNSFCRLVIRLNKEKK